MTGLLCGIPVERGGQHTTEKWTAGLDNYDTQNCSVLLLTFPLINNILFLGVKAQSDAHYYSNFPHSVSS